MFNKSKILYTKIIKSGLHTISVLLGGGERKRSEEIEAEEEISFSNKSQSYCVCFVSMVDSIEITISKLEIQTKLEDIILYLLTQWLRSQETLMQRLLKILVQV